MIMIMIVKFASLQIVLLLFQQQSEYESQAMDTTCSSLQEYEPGCQTGLLMSGSETEARKSRRTWDLRHARENWTSSRAAESDTDQSQPASPSKIR